MTLTNGLTILEYTQLTTAQLVEARRTPYSLVATPYSTAFWGIEYGATHSATPSSSSNQGAKCPTLSDNLLTLAMQPANTPCKAPRAQLLTGSSYTISYIMRPEHRRGMNLVMVGQERRTSEAFLVLRPVREVEVNGDTLPSKP